MSIYSRTLKHVNHKDFRRTRQRHLDEQEVLCKIERQKNLKEKKEIKEIKKLSLPYQSNWREELKIAQNQREEVVENSINKEYDWRKQIVFDRKKYFEEGMTSSGMFSIALPAIGDVNLSSPPLNSLGSHNASIVGGTVTISGDPSPFLTQGIILNFDAREYDTLKFDVSIPPGAVLGFLGANSEVPLLVVLSSGTHILTIPPNLRTQNFEIILDTPDSVTMSVSNFAFQRRTPMNVFVSLDSPEATAFIRTDPNLSNLSPKEKQQKLKEMLEASDEYVMKMLGFDFPGTGAVPPGEYDPFAQAPPGEAGDTPGVEIAQLYPADYDMERKIDQMLLKGLQRGDYGTGPDIDRQIKNLKKNLQQGTPGGLPQASTDQKYQVANYEPQGELISERRKLKSPEEVLNKIPGYYDGKPAPLGFPVEPPPEMVNGMHPDLVDGKKVADRFNRLDPQSAQAMPLTGNPHIDKKVLKARKQPK